MKIVHKLMVLASVVITTSANALKASAADYIFTQGDWTNGSAINTVLSGGFSATPQANGNISLQDLTSFSAAFPISNFNWSLENLSSFNFNPQTGLLNFRANKDITVITTTPNNFPPFNNLPPTVERNSTIYSLEVDSSSQITGNFNLTIDFSRTSPFGNNSFRGTVLTLLTSTPPQVSELTTVPEPANIGGLLTMAMSSWLLINRRRAII